ncbi:Cyclic-di-AMP phosphodiesterase GdpP [bioreactor metagenome]|uniref:Cyclic-di-AMP phosphodiesterase GdpP n=1 Tax=bioreactor metagenome TaxID=1076179 RepID=A0A644SWN3_9ZZZZ|nr:DHH family phosphoesterase [Negativicutes bacterium]
MPQGPSFWFDTRIYLLVAAMLLLVIVFYNKYVAVLGAILLFALYLYGRERHREQQKAISAFLDTMVHNVEEITTYALKNLPMAMVIVDADGKLKWCNSALFDWFSGDLKAGDSIIKVWPELPLDELWGEVGQIVFKAEDKHYQAIYKPLENARADNLMVFYVTDITCCEETRSECYAAMPVTAYIQIDNYDDVLQGLSDNQRADLMLEVNKTLSAWMDELDGFIKKYAEDMYLAILSRRSLDVLLKDKFEILDKVRAIKSGNKIPVTLSMGIVADEVTFGTMAERAQAGLDLALGRGGDQAAVHIAGKVQFYGGKATIVEKNTRVKARIVAQAIRESIEQADNVLVMGHVNEDFDSLGAAMGVAKMARHMNKSAHVVVSKSSMTVSKLTDLFEDYDEYKDLFISPTAAQDLITHDSLVFLVDAHRKELAAAPELLSVAERVIVIDHHRRSEGFVANPLLVYLEPSASSASELVTELLMYFDEKLDLTRLDATALYAGIVVDTKNFAVQAGVRTFDAASYLRRAGADPALVRYLFRVDFAIMKARAEIISNTEVLPGGIALAFCPANVDNAQIAAAQTADMLLALEGIRLSIVLFEMPDEGVGVSARSNGDINVHVLMEQLGGGGHQTVAGAQLKKVTIDEAKQQVIELVSNYIEESEQNESNPATRS